MQGLWSSHRKTRVNLNSPVSGLSTPATATVEDTPNSGASGPSIPMETSTAVGSANIDQDVDSPTVNGTGKRKIRSSRPAEGVSNKRSKTTAGPAGNIAKDYAPPSTRLADLGGVEACIEKMLELVAMPLCHPEVYLHTGVQPPRGVLLHGPPGCGKTLLAHAMAGVCFLSLS